MKFTDKAPTQTSFFHRTTTSISFLFAADSWTEQVSFYPSFNFHEQLTIRMWVPFEGTSEEGRSRDKMRRYLIFFATNVVSFFFFLNWYNYLFYFQDPVFHLLKKPWLRTTQFLFQNLKATVPVHIHPLFYSFIFSCVEPRHDNHQLANLL